MLAKNRKATHPSALIHQYAIAPKSMVVDHVGRAQGSGSAVAVALGSMPHFMLVLMMVAGYATPMLISH